MMSPNSRRERWVVFALALACAVLLRWHIGYTPYPAVEAYAYIPLAWHALDPTIYAGDVTLEGFVLHAPLWMLTVVLFEPTIGLPWGIWLFTLATNVASMIAAVAVLRSLGVGGWSLPLIVGLGFTTVLNIGRGAYGGLFGDDFHPHNVALVALLLAYSQLAIHRPLLGGSFLGLTFWPIHSSGSTALWLFQECISYPRFGAAPG